MIWLLALLLGTTSFAQNTPAYTKLINGVYDAAIKSPMGPALLCVRGDGAACTRDLIADPAYKKILLFPAGYTADDYLDFALDYTAFVLSMTQAPGDVYSTRYASKILYVAFWVAGPTLESGHAVFSAQIEPHPIRGTALTLDQSKVFSMVSSLHKIDPELFNPMSVAVLYNSWDTDATSNASTPTFLQRSYGIARFTRGNMYKGSYISVHELAHASLNFVDEYTEPGLEQTSIRTLDYLTPLAVMTGGWSAWVRSVRNFLGVYQYRISEILAANGSDNVDITRFPSRVRTPGYQERSYPYEGGMFFGKGTFHDRGKNIMNGDDNSHGLDDGLDYAHSASQWDVVKTAFEHPGVAARPNDRIRAAGPHGSWRFEWGKTTHLLLFDADKNHHFQPTKRYTVQLGWWQRDWHLCWGHGFLPYPCRRDRWVTVEKDFAPTPASIELKDSALYAFASATQSIACHLGYKTLKSGAGSFSLCQQSLNKISDDFLPTLVFPTPYQDVPIPAAQWMTKYYWRFRTDNGTFVSGWTAWSAFSRSL